MKICGSYLLSHVCPRFSVLRQFHSHSSYFDPGNLLQQKLPSSRENESLNPKMVTIPTAYNPFIIFFKYWIMNEIMKISFKHKLSACNVPE